MWYDKLTTEEREEQYSWAIEGWHETYAEAGSDFVFGGGSPSDAMLVASQTAGAKPKRSDYGLEEPEVTKFIMLNKDGSPWFHPDSYDIPF